MLCLAVMLSVMVVGAGAAFSDQDKIENTEAVDACSALNIINGYEDGAFHPERNIKRAEVTKMICVALNGGEEPNTSTNAKPTFTDVRGTIYAWAEGYIESCVAQGIVDGVGGTRFAPAGNVTAAQLAKMLLVSLGYNATTEKFTGNAWETNVNVRAAQKHLYDGLEKMDTSAAVTRDQAAQMVWNAMQAYEVEYKDGVVQDKVVGQTDDKITLLRDRYDALISVGTLTSIEKTGLSISMNAADKLASDAPYVDSFSKLAKDYSSLMGQKVKVVYKRNHSDQVLGVFATGDNTVVTVNQKDISVDAGKLSIGDKKYSLEANGVNVYKDGKAQKDNYKAKDFDNERSASVLTFIDSDGNGKIDTACEKTYEVAKVTYASDKQIIAGGKTYKADEDNLASGLAKNDWVVVTHNLFQDNMDVAKADLATGKLSATKNKDNNTWKQYQIGDTWYNEAEANTKDINGNAKPGADVEYVAVNGILFYAARTTGTATLDDILFVSYVGTNGLNDNQAKVMFPNGNTTTITLDETKIDSDFDGVYDDDVINNANAAGKFFEFTKSSKGYKLSKLRDEASYPGYYGDYTHVDDMSDALTMKDSSNATTGKADTLNGIKIDDNANVIIFSKTGVDPNFKSAVKHITGKQLKNLTLGGGANQLVNKAVGAFTSDVNGLTRVTVLAVEWTDTNAGTLDNMSAGGSHANYGFILGEDAHDLGDTISFKLWTVDGEKDVVAEVGNTANYTEGAIVGYASIEEKDGTSIIKDSEPVVSGKVTTGSIKKSNDKTDGKIQLVGVAGEMDLSDYTTVLYVNSKDGEGVKNGVPAVASKVEVNGQEYYATNVLYSTDTLDFVVIDTVEFTTDTYSACALNQPADMTGLNSVQYVNSRTDETDTSSFNNAVVELRVNAQVAGTMTLTDAVNTENGTNVLNVAAGDNTFNIVVTGDVTPTFTPASVTPPTSNILVVVGTPSGELTYKANNNFTVDVSAKNAFGKKIVVESIEKDNAGADVKSNFTINADTAFVNDAGETKTLTIAEKGDALPGNYTATVKVGDSASQNFVFTVKSAKVVAAPALDLSGVTVSLSANQTPKVDNQAATVTGSVTGVDTTGAKYSVTEKTNAGTADTVEVNDVWTIIVKIPAQAGYEFTDPTTVGSLTNVNLTKDGNTSLGNATASLENAGGTLILTYEVTIEA